MQLVCRLLLSQVNRFLSNILKGKDNILVKASKMTVTDDSKVSRLRHREAYFSLVNRPGGQLPSMQWSWDPGFPILRPHHPLGPCCHLYQAGGRRREQLGHWPHALPSTSTHLCAFNLWRDLGHVATPNCRADRKCSLAVCQGTVEHGAGGTVSNLHPGVP